MSPLRLGNFEVWPILAPTSVSNGSKGTGRKAVFQWGTEGSSLSAPEFLTQTPGQTCGEVAGPGFLHLRSWHPQPTCPRSSHSKTGAQGGDDTSHHGCVPQPRPLPTTLHSIL